MFCDRLTISMNVYYLEGEDYRLYMDYWGFWKASYYLFWRHNFRAAVLFRVSFFASSFYLLLSATSLYCTTLKASEVYSQTRISVLPGGYIIFQSCLILLQYRHIFSFRFLNRDGSFFLQHSTLKLGGKFSWMIFEYPFLEENHRVIGPGLLCLNRFNYAVWYLFGLFILVPIRYLNGVSTYLCIRT